MPLEKKNAFWNMAGTAVNSFVSLLLLMLITRINGLEWAGVFSLHYATACILFVLGTYVNRVFQVTDIHGEYSVSDYFFHRMLALGAVALLSLLIALAMGYDRQQGAVLVSLCLYRGIDAVGEYFYGLFQKENRLYLVGYSMLLKTAAVTVIFGVVDLLTRSLPAACLAAVLANFVCLLLFDLSLAVKMGFAVTRTTWAQLWRLTRCCFIPFALTALNTYFAYAAKYASSAVLSLSEQGVLSMILMPGTFFILLGNVLFMQSTYKINRHLLNGDQAKMKGMLASITLRMAVICVPVCILAWFFEAPVLEWLFATRLNDYRLHMSLILLGSAFYSMQYVYCHCCVSLRKTGRVMIAYLACLGCFLLAQGGFAAWKGLLGVCILYLGLMAALAFAMAWIALSAVRGIDGKPQDGFNTKCVSAE